MLNILSVINNKHFQYGKDSSKDQFTRTTRSIFKKISDVVTLGTFCYRDQSFINRSGVGYFFHRIVGILTFLSRKNFMLN